MTVGKGQQSTEKTREYIVFYVCALVNLVNMNAKITIALKEDVNLQDIMIWTTNTQIVVMKMRCIINHPPIPPKTNEI
jgi:hypothetical protein